MFLRICYSVILKGTCPQYQKKLVGIESFPIHVNATSQGHQDLESGLVQAVFEIQNEGRMSHEIEIGVPKTEMKKKVTKLQTIPI